jgi:hypothetical protein
MIGRYPQESLLKSEIALDNPGERRLFALFPPRDFDSRQWLEDVDFSII